jgi:hypothetical protein
MHFFNPVHRMKLLEVVRALETSEATIAAACQVGVRMNKECVVVRESPGFVTSRINARIGNEAFYMLQEGVASAADIDKALKLGLNHPMGPFELVDLVGLDTRLSILRFLHRTLGEKFRPCPLIEQYVAGRLGRKTGRLRIRDHGPAKKTSTRHARAKRAASGAGGAPGRSGRRRVAAPSCATRSSAGQAHAQREARGGPQLAAGSGPAPEAGRPATRSPWSRVPRPEAKPKRARAPLGEFARRRPALRPDLACSGLERSRVVHADPGPGRASADRPIAPARSPRQIVLHLAHWDRRSCTSIWSRLRRGTSARTSGARGSRR